MNEGDPAVRKPRFSDEYRADLRRLGLVDAQIEKLETPVLPLIAMLTSNKPKLQGVRDELEAVARYIRAAHDRLSKFKAAAGPVWAEPVAEEAR